MLIVLVFAVSIGHSFQFTLCSVGPGPSFGVDNSQWNYLNTTAWQDLSNSQKCGGQSQSPINILTNQAVASSNAVLMETVNATLTIEHLASTLEAVGDYSHLQLNELIGNKIQALYISKQFHIHTPSEHQIDGKSFPLEVHFVHIGEGTYCSNLTNKITVIGVLFQVDNSSAISFFNDMAQAEENSTLTNFNLQTSILKNIPATANYFSYTGSLTTPPCLETVNWLVLNQTLPIKQADLDLLTKYFQFPDRFDQNTSNRPVQALNNRQISMTNLKMYNTQTSDFSNLSSFWMYNTTSNNLVNNQLFVAPTSINHVVEINFSKLLTFMIIAYSYSIVFLM